MLTREELLKELKKGKRPFEIAQERGIDRKKVNNMVTAMRAVGIEIPLFRRRGKMKKVKKSNVPTARAKTVRIVETGVYEKENGKYLVKVGTRVRSFNNLEDALEFRRSGGKVVKGKRKYKKRVSYKKRVKTTPEVTEVHGSNQVHDLTSATNDSGYVLLFSKNTDLLKEVLQTVKM